MEESTSPIGKKENALETALSRDKVTCNLLVERRREGGRKQLDQ